MKLCKTKEPTNYIVSKDLSLGAIGLLNALLIKSNSELENLDIYSISNDARKEIALQFRELRKAKYIIYNSIDDTYYIYLEPHN